MTDDIDELRSTLAHLDLALEYDPQNLELLHARADLVAAIGPQAMAAMQAADASAAKVEAAREELERAKQENGKSRRSDLRPSPISID